MVRDSGLPGMQGVRGLAWEETTVKAGRMQGVMAIFSLTHSDSSPMVECDA